MSVLLSTGQVRDDTVKTKLKGMFSSEKKEQNNEPGMLRSGIASGGRAMLDDFVGSWAGDMFYDKMTTKKDKSEKSLSFKDYIKITKSELKSLFQREKEQTVEGFEDIGVKSQKDLEEFIKASSESSMAELVKHIDSNGITDRTLISDLLEATKAANNEIEKGLRSEFDSALAAKYGSTEKVSSTPVRVEQKQEKTSSKKSGVTEVLSDSVGGGKGSSIEDSKNIERIAIGVEELNSTLVKQNQDIYKSSAKDAPKAPSAIPVKDGKSPIMELLGSLLPKLSAVLPGIISSFSALMAPLGALLLPLAGMAAAFVGLKLVVETIFNKDGQKPMPTESGDYSLEKPVEDMSTMERFRSRVGAKRRDVEEFQENGGIVSEKEAAEIKKSYGIEWDKSKVSKGDLTADQKNQISQGKATVADFEGQTIEPAKIESVQQSQAETLNSESSKLTENKAEGTQAAPIVIPAPSAPSGGQASAGPSENLNYTTVNSDNTLRRLNEKNFALAYI